MSTRRKVLPGLLTFLLATSLALGATAAQADPSLRAKGKHYSTVLKLSGGKFQSCLTYTPSAEPTGGGYTVFNRVDGRKSRVVGDAKYAIYRAPTTIGTVLQPTFKAATGDLGWFPHTPAGKGGGNGIYGGDINLYSMVVKLKADHHKKKVTVQFASIPAC